MNTTELIQKVAKEQGLARSKAQAIVQGVFKSIMTTVKSGDKVQLTGFGTFSFVERGARKGRNPATGEAIKIKAMKTPKFKAGKEFKQAVSGRRK